MRDKRTLFIVLILLASILPFSLAMGDPGWLTGWNYRKSHKITGSIAGAQTLFQIPLLVYYGAGSDLNETVYLNSKCETDFSDIRFTSDDGTTLIPYWIESQVDSDNIEVWVRVPTIPVHPNNATIYIYYNGTGPSLSNGYDTWEMYSDCNATNEWEVDYTASTPSWGLNTVDGATTVRIEANSNGDKLRLRYVNSTAQARELRRFKFRVKNTNWNSDGYMSVYPYYDAADVYGAYIYYSSFLDQMRPYSFIPAGNTYEIYATAHPSGWNEYWGWVDSTGEVWAYYNANLIGSPERDGDDSGGRAMIYIGQFGTGLNIMYLDWFYTGKWIDPSPYSIEWGTEEEPPTLESPNKLFGAGFNGSTPVVHLYWTTNLTGITLFEIQNSTDKTSWDTLGSNNTTEYHDFQLVNGTERYYRVRACNFTGSVWDNSSFTDINFETVYFVEAAVGPPAEGDTIIMGASGVFWIILIIIVPIVAYVLKKG